MKFHLIDDCEVVRTTERAVLVRQNGQEIWIPRSACEDGESLSTGDTDVVVSEWFADKESLSY